MLTQALKIYYSFPVCNYQIIVFIILREISKEVSLQREVFNFPISFFIIWKNLSSQNNLIHILVDKCYVGPIQYSFNFLKFPHISAELLNATPCGP